MGTEAVLALSSGEARGGVADGGENEAGMAIRAAREAEVPGKPQSLCCRRVMSRRLTL